MLELNETLGIYRPGYFEIYVKTDKPIELNNLSRKEMSTFFHEWIHFLQDFTTGVGCNNSYANIELLKYLGKKCQSLPAPVKLPVPLGTEYNVRANAFIVNNEWGYAPMRTDYKNITVYENKNIDIPRCLITDSGITSIPICLATTDLGDEFRFGTHAIMESMAFECQIYIYPESEPDHGIYPYHTARLVADHILPGFTDDRLRLIALCDMSLMSSAPGPQFTSYLRNIKDGKIPSPNKPEEIYDWFYRNGTSLIKGYEEINDLTRKSFLGILKDPVAFSAFHKWIKNAYTHALEIRQHDRYFILELLRKGDASKNPKLRDLINEFGTPLLRNVNYDYTKISIFGNDEWDVEHLQAVWEVKNLLWDDKFSCCSLLRWCINSDNEKMKNGAPVDLVNPDERCRVNPSLRSTDTRKCPFGLVWYAMGLPETTR